MDDDAKNKLKMVLAALAVVIAVGLAIRSGIHSVNPPLKVVGHLGGNMQGPSTPVNAPTNANNVSGAGADNPDRK